MKSKKMLTILLLITIFSLIIVGCSTSNEDTDTLQNNETEKQTVIASTSWTAFIAEAAGANNVTILAPVELRHPPEYDFKPSDLNALQEADWVIMAGYEPFMKKMLESNSIDEEKIIQIMTTNTYNNLIIQTKAIAEKLGTQEIQQDWENEFTSLIDLIMQKSNEKDVKNIRVVVHTHIAEFAKSLGYNVIEVFGAEELSPAKLGELAKLNPDLIIDNFHNPQGMGISEISNAPRVELRNFPGPEHNSLIDLFIDNAKKLGVY